MVSVIDFKDVSYVRGGRKILDGINWQVTPGQRWIILGPNGAGKSTLLKLAAAYDYPSSGTVDILEKRLGRVDVFELRSAIGAVAASAERKIPAQETVRDVVLTAAYAVCGRWKENYEAIDVRRAERVLAEWNLTHLADRSFGTLSDGERKRVMIARAVMTDPEMLLLDEPAASIDLGGREQLIASLSGFAMSEAAPAMVMVTHHVEEIPRGFTHLLLLDAAGRIYRQGAITETLTADNLSAVFGFQIELTGASGRFFAIARQ